jgi:chitinase
VLTSTLQTLFSSVSPRRYISAAPLCANNTVLPTGVYANANFVWPRFYNAKACCVGSKGFNASVIKWSNYLGSIASAPSLDQEHPRFLLGGLSFNNSNSGFVLPDKFAEAVLSTRDLVGSLMFGGVGLWQGTDALVTTNPEGRDFLNVTKTALLSEIGNRFVRSSPFSKR